MNIKTTGKEYFYSVSGLIPPKYMVSDSLVNDIEFFVDWISRNANVLEELVSCDKNAFVTEMERLYELLCGIHAHWLEMEAARILRLAEIDEGEICQQLIEPLVSNLKTLALDIQMAQSMGFKTSYRQHSEIERYRSLINSLKVVSQLLECGDLSNALEFAVSIDELRESAYAMPLINLLASQSGESAVSLIDEITEVYSSKIDASIASATDSISLKKIMFVDDMPEVLTALSVMLKEYYQIFPFSSCSQALNFLSLKKQTPDAIILDIEMPEMDGFTLAEKIRANPALENTPIIFLTGNSKREIFLKAIKFGAKAFIVKPVNKDILVSKLSRCMNSSI